MSSDIKNGRAWFGRVVIKVEAGRMGAAHVTKMSSQHDDLKIAGQMVRSSMKLPKKTLLLKTWARWEIAMRLEEQGIIPQTITITASDVDDFGAYASDLGRTLQIA